MTAVIYARYSSDNQREESIEGQIRECKAFADKNDIHIVGSYIDRALSAKTDNVIYLYDDRMDIFLNQKWSNAYNLEWQSFFLTFAHPTMKQIIEKVIELAQKYGFELQFPH